MTNNQSTASRILRRNNVTVSGTGSDTIVFANGFGCSQATWRHVAPTFRSQHRVVLFDYVGSGGSDLQAYDPKRYASLHGYAQDLLDVCDAVGLQRCTLVAHSVSCMIGLMAAVERPALFDRIVFVSPSPYFFRDGEYDGGLDRADVDALFEMMEQNYLGWSSVMAPMIMGNADRPELGQSLTESFCATDPDIARAFARVTFYTDCRPYLAQSPVDTLTLQCTNDVLAPSHIGAFIRQHTPGNQLVHLKATGHCPHLSAPTETVATIKQYLADGRHAFPHEPSAN